MAAIVAGYHETSKKVKVFTIIPKAVENFLHVHTTWEPLDPDAHNQLYIVDASTSYHSIGNGATDPSTQIP
jgi:hypothetical protein